MAGPGSVLVDPGVRAALARVRAGVSTADDAEALRLALVEARREGFTDGWFSCSDVWIRNGARDWWRTAWAAARTANVRASRPVDSPDLVAEVADVLAQSAGLVLGRLRSRVHFGPGPLEDGLAKMRLGWPVRGSAAETCMLNAIGLNIGAAAQRLDFDERVTLRAWQRDRDSGPVFSRLLMMAAALRVERDKLRRGAAWEADEAWAYGRIAQVAEWRRQLEAKREERRVREEARRAFAREFADRVASSTLAPGGDA